jgi:hypothetical protein
MNDLKRLQQAIRDLHGLDSEHVESVPVHEQFSGETMWQGTVEVFRVRGHPQAEFAYAWSHETDDGKINHVAVLGIPPVDNPEMAVRAAIMAHVRKHAH